MDSTSNFGVGVYLDYRVAEYDSILKLLKLDRVRTTNVTAKEEKATERANRNKILLDSGQKTPNEGRRDEGLDPIVGGDVLVFNGNYKTLDQIVNPPDPVLPAALPAAGVKGGDKPGDNANPADQKKRVALAQWERKALRLLKDGKPAACEFLTEDVPEPVTEHIARKLAGCRSEVEVKAVFRASSSMPVFEAMERVEWAKEAADELEAFAAAVGA